MMIVYIAIVVVLLMVVVIATRPTDFSVTRSISIAAPPEVVFGLVNDLHKWEGWSPWAKMDPNSKMAYEGPVAGTGAAFTWAGNMQVGEGRTTITESRANELVRLRLDFVKPMKSTSTAEFSFKPEGNQTLVQWTMWGKNNFMAKAFSLILNVEKMIGGNFETGLASMKSLAEGAAKAPPTGSRTVQ